MVNAQGWLEGQVVDPYDQTPMANATVMLQSSDAYDLPVLTTQTDAQGHFWLDSLAQGSYRLEVLKAGFTTLAQSNIRICSEEATILEPLQLSVAPIELMDVVTIIAYQLPDLLDEPCCAVRFPAYDYEWAHSPHSKNLMDYIGTFGHGIYQQDLGQPLHIRGSRAGATSYIVDGLPVRNGLQVTPSSVASIRAFTSHVPAQYGDCLGGVVVVETQNSFERYYQYQAQ